MSKTKQASARGRHSFIQFYMNDWLAGTARMSRIARSIYFDICVYSWDKAQPVPHAELFLMVSDIENQQQAEFLIKNMVDTGKLVENEDGSVYSPRALAEGERSLAAWKAKSQAGKKRAANAASKATDEPKSSDVQDDSSNIAETKLEDGSIERERERERERESSLENDDIIDDEKNFSDLELKRGIPDRWNAMALSNGLRQVIEMNKGRTAKLDKLVSKYGAEKINEVMDTIPNCSYMLGFGDDGWKVSFDWFTNSDNFVKVLEGAYQDEEPAKVEKTPPEPAKPPKIVAVHPDEGDLGKKVRAFLVEEIGQDKFRWIFSNVQFHQSDNNLAVVPETPAVNISDFMVNHGPILQDAAKHCGLNEAWGMTHSKLKALQQHTIDAREK